MSNELTTTNQPHASELIDKVVKELQKHLDEATKNGNLITKALVLARALRTLQSLCTPAVMEDMMALQGTVVGFRTDREKPKHGPVGYPVEIVRDVCIQAFLRGFDVTGNNINIIAGNLYPTKEGYENRLQNFPGLRDLQINLEVPEILDSKVALVGATASWLFHGRDGFIECVKSEKQDTRIPIKAEDYTTFDAIQGKAKRKLYAKIFERVSGMSFESQDNHETVDAETVTTVEPLPVVENQTKTKPRQSIPLDAAPEALPESIAADLHMSLDAVADLSQLTGNWKHWDQKAKNRTFTDGQKVTIRNAFSKRKAELEATVKS